MSVIFGNFIEELPPSTEFLLLGFSPSSLPIKQRWRNNGLSADFLADYMTTFFPSESASKHADIKNTVSYIANELLENAMKYSDESLKKPISLGLHLFDDKFIFIASNPIAQRAVPAFQACIKEILESDPYELYLQRIEANSESDTPAHSGLGYLTMINDYHALLGWKFEEVEDDPAIAQVSTMVQVSL
jgi:hypothetical protein